jgi:hypothetical protein
MALPTYLELVNDVLVRMREPEVSTVQENVLSKLVGKLVNDSKRQVEDAYKWNALITTINLSTVASTSNYTLTGTGQRFKIVGARNVTQKLELRNIPVGTMDEWLEYSAQNASPGYYAFNGVNTTTGDAKLDVYPVPDGVYNLKFETYIPQGNLTSDGTLLQVPSEPVILGAFARALVERGEDGGLNSSEAYGLYRSSLADHIAIEASRFAEDDGWEAV